MMKKIALYKLILSAILLIALTPIESWSFSISPDRGSRWF